MSSYLSWIERRFPKPTVGGSNPSEDTMYRRLNMVPSVDTIQQILEVMGRHVDKPTLKRIVDQLVEIPGNQSFQDTVMRIKEAREDSEDSK